MTETFTRRIDTPVSPAELMAWHERPGAFGRLTPPWAAVEVIEAPADLRDGIAKLRVGAGGIPVRWTLQHRDYIPGRQFRDVQIDGPFGAYAHTHRMEPSPDGSTLVDHIEYTLPLGPLGALGRRFVRAQFDQLFTWRHRIMTDDLTAHARTDRTLTVAVSGASGLVGSALCDFLTTGGHTVRRLVRRQAKNADEIGYDPDEGRLDPADLEGIDAVVHLAGEPIMGRWSTSKKARILESRVQGTRLIAETIARLDDPPAVFVCASAIGYYGDRGDIRLTEADEPGEGFLADVCIAWEAACRPAIDAGVRVVNTRFGIVLSGDGGALAQMLTPFKLGLGGPVGGGDQYWSWIARDDAIGAIHHAIITDGVKGPINVTAPEPVTSREFARTLGRVLGRPAVIPAPAFALKLVFGEAADEMLLAGQRVLPTILADTGYTFRHPHLEDALRVHLGKTAPTEARDATAR